MEIVKDWKKNPDKDPWMNRDPEKSKRNTRKPIERDFEESMREDMRGPMEGMEEVPAASLPPRQVHNSMRQSESMINGGGHP